MQSEKEQQKNILNWEQNRAIELQVDGRLPELSEFLLKNGRLKQTERILGEISAEEKITDLEKEKIEEEELEKTLRIQREYEKEKRAKENEVYLLKTKVIQKIAEKKRNQATELIVDYIEAKNYIYTTKDDIKSEMWIYSQGVYIPQGKSYIKELCRNILGELYTTQLTNEVIAKIEADTFIEQDVFFATNYIEELPLLNGILNIRTKKLTPHEPKKIFFNKLPIQYDPKATCPNIMEHFETVLKDKDEILVLLEIFGYLLLKEYKIEKAFMFVGGGRNGKSKTIELMKRFIGAENCSSLPLKSLHEESFSLSELFGKMANLAADLSRTDLKETGMIKSLIGRDTIQAKRKFLRDLNFVNYAKMVFAANELPKIYDTTDGFWTKWVLIEFPYQFVPKKTYDELEDKSGKKIMNPDIVEALTTPQELSGLLNLAIESLHRLLKNRDFSYSKSVSEVKDLWIRQSDSFTAFCYDSLEEDSEIRISKRELRKRYHDYRKKHKLPGASDKAIRVTLENLYGAGEWQDWQSKDRFWEGIKWKI